MEYFIGGYVLGVVITAFFAALLMRLK